MLRCALIPLLLLATSVLALADAIVVSRAMRASTICEIFVEREAVRVEFEIGLGDLEQFQNLMPDEIHAKMGLPAAPFAERFARFHREDLVFTADGQPLVPRIRMMETRDRVVRDEITGDPLPPGENPERVIFAELVYPLDGEPKTLAITPGRAGNLGFTTYHLGLAVMEFRYLGMPATLTLDWEDPWYSEFKNRNLRRTYRYPISAFLYVEPYEVRVEIVARPRDLQQWTDLGLEGRDTIPVEIQEEMEKRAAEFLAANVDLAVDGEEVTPVLDRLNFLERTLRSSSVIDPRRELPAHNATIGAIFVHPIDTLPREASLAWKLFTPKMASVSAAATDEAGPLPFTLTPDDPVLVWKNFLKKPTIPTLLAVAAPPSHGFPLVPVLLWSGCGLGLLVATRFFLRGRFVSGPGLAAAVGTAALAAAALWQHQRAASDKPDYSLAVNALLKNMYHAFDFRGDEKVYDTLAHSVSGELLRTAYLEIRKGLVLASQGGAQVKVKEVEVLELEALESGDHPRFRCAWTVGGSVGHWGHIHQRRNRYDGELQLEIVDGAWKISKLDLTSEERVQ